MKPAVFKAQSQFSGSGWIGAVVQCDRVLTGCRCGPAAKTQSPVHSPAWCCGTGSALVAAPQPASGESAGGEEGASPMEAGTLRTCSTGLDLKHPTSTTACGVGSIQKY